MKDGRVAVAVEVGSSSLSWPLCGSS